MTRRELMRLRDLFERRTIRLRSDASRILDELAVFPAHGLRSSTRVGQPLLGNYMRPSGCAMWLCRCGVGFVALTDAGAEHAFVQHLRGARIAS